MTVGSEVAKEIRIGRRSDSRNRVEYDPEVDGEENAMQQPRSRSHFATMLKDTSGRLLLSDNVNLLVCSCNLTFVVVVTLVSFVNCFIFAR